MSAVCFEKVIEISSKSFSTLDKDPDESYLKCQKVEKLLQCIQMPDMEVVAQKLVVASQSANDFLGACNYFSAQVSHLHGRAKLENSKYMKKCNVSAMHGCGSRNSGHSGGLECFGGHGRFGGHSEGCSGGRGGGGNDSLNFSNGIEVKTLQMKNGGNLCIIVDDCMWLRLVNK
jgi:hypothetical protein